MLKGYMKEYLKKLLIVFMVMTLTIVPLLPYQSTYAKEVQDIIDEVILIDQAGNIIDTEKDPHNNVSLDDVVKILFKWSIKDESDVKAGDIAQIKLPDCFKVHNEVNGYLQMENGTLSMGTFQLSENKLLTVVFNDNVEKYSNINGEIQFSTHFDKEYIVNNNITTIEFKVNENTLASINVQFTPINTNENISKSHETLSYNAKEINWQIKINKRLDYLENVSVEDVLSDGQELSVDSIKILKLKYNL